jgi:carbamoyltransferase
MNTLGVSGAVGHAASAALFVEGQLLAAAEEERFLHDKHAKGKFPLLSSCYCLEYLVLNI